MKKIAALCITVLVFGISYGQDNKTGSIKRYMTDSLDVIAARVQKQIIPCRYMEQTLIMETDTVKGWEGIPVKLYEYKLHDKVKGGEVKGQVFLADADSRKTASWIITTCVRLTGKLSKSNTDLLIKSIRFASGGQFPVKGMVYEDMYGTGQTCYYFKDGVTVYLKNPDPDNVWAINDDNIERTGKYARIISTNREEYIKMFGYSDLEGKAWLNVVKQEYKKALLSDTNNLMIAWANGKLEIE